MNISGAKNLSVTEFQKFTSSHALNLKELELCPMPIISDVENNKRENSVQIENNKKVNSQSNNSEAIINSIGELKSLQILGIGYIADSPTNTSMMALSQLYNLRSLHIQVTIKYKSLNNCYNFKIIKKYFFTYFIVKN